jgi:hypothetical protein
MEMPGAAFDRNIFDQGDITADTGDQLWLLEEDES